MANLKPMGTLKTVIAISGALLASATVLGSPSQAQAKIYGFQCLKAGPANAPAYLIGLGTMPAPEGGTASSSGKAAPLEAGLIQSLKMGWAGASAWPSPAGP